MILVHEPKEFKERYNWSCLHREPRAVPGGEGPSGRRSLCRCPIRRAALRRVAGWPPSALRRCPPWAARGAPGVAHEGKRMASPDLRPLAFCVVASLGRRL